MHALGVFFKKSGYDNKNITVSIQVVNIWKRSWMKNVPKKGIPRWCQVGLSFLQMWCAMEERTYSMADLCYWRMTWTHKSIQVEGVVCSGQLIICAHILDSQGLRQKNQNNRRQVCMVEQDQDWHHLGIYQEHLIDGEHKDIQNLECVKQWRYGVKGCKRPMNLKGNKYKVGDIC